MNTPTIPITPSILRMAAQLGQDPETLAAGILHHAARVVDWNLATGCHPLCFATDGDDLAGFDLTAAMDRLTPRQIEGLDAGVPPGCI
jgi:hypothetical protein